MSGYRIIERTLCGGRDLFEHHDAKVVAQWLYDCGYFDKGYLDNGAKQDVMLYVLTPDAEEISSFKLLIWVRRQLGITFFQRIAKKLRIKD